MAGLRNSRSAHHAGIFVDRLTSLGEEIRSEFPSKPILIGPNRVDLVLAVNPVLSDLILGAFYSSSAANSKATYRVTVCQLGENLELPHYEWAREWIDSGVQIPHHLTSPNLIFIDRNQGITYCFNSEKKTATIVLRRSQHLDVRSFITPFRILWSWLARHDQGVILHAGSVAREGKALLLAGPSGSGKSTLSILGGNSEGNRLLSDDCSWVDEGGVYPVFCRIKTSFAGPLAGIPSESVQEWPWIGAAQSKPFANLGDAPAHRESTPLVGIVLPVIDVATTYFRVSPSRANDLLTQDSLRELHGGSLSSRLALSRLVAAVPSFRLLLGPNHYDNVQALERIRHDAEFVE